MPAFNKKTILDWSKALTTALLFVLFIRGFILEPFTIPSPSMENSLYPGDFIMVNKLSYGPRLIRTPLCIPFMEKKMFSTLIRFPYFRFFGAPDVERNDVVVFNYPLDDEFPVDHRTHFIKRCIGLPGDSIKVSGGKVYVNGKLHNGIPSVQYNYNIQTKDEGLDSAFLAEHEITEGGLISEKGDYSFSLSAEDTLKVQRHRNVLTLCMNCEKEELWDETIFPFNESYPWNADNFGALYIPKEGDTLKLDSVNICLYERLIRVYEGNDLLRIDSGKFIINGDTTSIYITKMNYYFMMGDNRHNSMDSRYWGFLPEDHIVGKASFIFYSYDRMKGKTRWERVFSGIK
jgi:signal peptidase I